MTALKDQPIHTVSQFTSKQEGPRHNRSCPATRLYNLFHVRDEWCRKRAVKEKVGRNGSIFGTTRVYRTGRVIPEATLPTSAAGKPLQLLDISSKVRPRQPLDLDTVCGLFDYTKGDGGCNFQI